jgi:SAM-dependent methyltransferase
VIKRTKPIYLNLGCGSTAPAAWINCDSSWNAQIGRIPLLKTALRKLHLASNAEWPKGIKHLQLKRKFPWASDAIDVVYASHVLEHLDSQTRDNFLREAHRVLKADGVLRLVVPDLHYHARKYVESLTQESSGAEEFLHTINLRMPDATNLLRRAYYFAMGFPHLHKNMYDSVTLAALVRRYGFQPIGYFSYGYSCNIPNVKEIECREGAHDGSIYLEARKSPAGAD